MKKIALCGTHGIGKTTALYRIAYTLKKYGYNVHTINETARSCPLPINKEATIDTQKWILGKQLMLESELQYKKDKIDFILCDRSILDVFIYGFLIDPDFSKSIEPLMKEHMKTFDLILHLQKDDSHFRNDGERCIDSHFRNKINQLFLETIKIYEIPVVRIKLDELKEYMKSYIKEVMKK